MTALAWVVGRLVTVAALAVATAVAVAAQGALPRHPGLTVYDASWYSDLAARGYSALPREALRFFPLFPEMSRWLDAVLPGPAAVATVVLANGCALGYGLLLWHLVRTDLPHLDPTGGLASRTVWLVFLAPAGFVLVLGYAEALAGLLTVAAFLAARRGRFALVIPLAFAAGLTRPVGVLLAVPVAIELIGCLARRPRRRDWAVGVLAVLAPLAGAASYLLWVGQRYGDPLLPLRIQQQGGLRGSLVALPLAPLKHSAIALVHGVEPTTAAHLLWVPLFVALLVVAAVRLPASYTAFAAVMLGVALTARTLDSFERYAQAAFPLFIALALVLRRKAALQAVLAVFAATMLGYATLAFLQLYTP